MILALKVYLSGIDKSGSFITWKGVVPMRSFLFLSFLLIPAVLTGGVVFAAETVPFEPVRAPSMGPEDAPVTVVEIADFM